MLRWISAWFRKQQKWRDDHKREWAGLTGIGPSGVSLFQKKVLGRLEINAPTLVFRLEGKQEQYFVANVSDSGFKVFVFPDGIQVFEKRFLMREEEWDRRTPDEMIEILISILKSRGWAS